MLVVKIPVWVDKNLILCFNFVGFFRKTTFRLNTYFSLAAFLVVEQNLYFTFSVLLDKLEKFFDDIVSLYCPNPKRNLGFWLYLFAPISKITSMLKNYWPNRQNLLLDKEPQTALLNIKPSILVIVRNLVSKFWFNKHFNVKKILDVTFMKMNENKIPSTRILSSQWMLLHCEFKWHIFEMYVNWSLV